LGILILVAETANKAFTALKNALDGYTKISNETWLSLKAICKFRALDKNAILYQMGEIPVSFSFVYSGLLRNFVIDENGNEYNKIFFDEGTFPGSMVALLKSEPSQFTIEALEPSSIIEINFIEYRKLLIKKHDLKLFQIYYLEKNWLITKEGREIDIVQNDAAYRYKKFLKEYASLENRLPQYHIASHLGITPTQLSRIRKNI
jgi:CRP-like cAMP-binding protein